MKQARPVARGDVDDRVVGRNVVVDLDRGLDEEGGFAPPGAGLETALRRIASQRRPDGLFERHKALRVAIAKREPADVLQHEDVDDLAAARGEDLRCYDVGAEMGKRAGEISEQARAVLAGDEQRDRAAFRRHARGDDITALGERASMPGDVAFVEAGPICGFKFEQQRRQRAEPVNDCGSAVLGAAFKLALHAGLVGAPAAQRGGGVAVKVCEQLAFPGVPDGGADGFDVGDSEDVKEAQALQRADEAGEGGDGARIGNVALLGGFAHLEVVANDPDDEIGFVVWQAEAFAGPARGGHAGFLLVALPLTGIVQQHREIQRAAVLDLAEQFVRERGDVAAPVFEIGDGLDGAQRVLIDRVMMIHVELGLRDDRAEFGDRAAEHAGLVHAAQGEAGLLAAEDGVEDQRAGFRHLAHGFCETAQVARQRCERGGVDVLLLAPGQGEEADHVERIARHDGVVRDADAAGVDHEARLRQRLRRAGGKETAQAFGLFLMVCFQLGSEDARQAADILGDEEIALHEALDALLALAVSVAHAGGDLGLQVETQPVLGAAGDEVDVAAHGPEKTRSADEDSILMIRERTGFHNLLQGVAAVHVLADPVERLQVAKTALAFL